MGRAAVRPPGAQLSKDQDRRGYWTSLLWGPRLEIDDL
jgi:hypothetical protein